MVSLNIAGKSQIFKQLLIQRNFIYECCVLVLDTQKKNLFFVLLIGIAVLMGFSHCLTLPVLYVQIVYVPGQRCAYSTLAILLATSLRNYVLGRTVRQMTIRQCSVCETNTSRVQLLQVFADYSYTQRRVIFALR